MALRELLYLAGNYCYVLDNGVYDTQEEFQEGARSWLNDWNRSITRPFFVISQHDAEQFLFVYLDEDQNDPVVYVAVLPRTPPHQVEWINPLYTPNLSKFINLKMSMFLSGYNPM